LSHSTVEPYLHLKELHGKYKANQNKYYDNRHRVRSLPQLPDDTPVWLQTENSQEPGTIVHQAATPRSYLVSTPREELRRNRVNLRPRPGQDNTVEMNRAPDTLQVQQSNHRTELPPEAHRE